MTYQNSTTLDDLFITADPVQPAPLNQRAAGSPSPAKATRTPRKAAKPATDKTTIAEGIPSIMNEVEIAALLGIATSQVRTKTRDGILVKARDARWDVRASLQGYLAQLRDGTVKGGGQVPDDLKAAKLRQTEAAAQKLEIANSVSKGELIPVADVRREWTTLAIDLRTAIMAIPARVTTQLGLDREAQAAIEAEIRLALEEIADHG
ncbi:MAG: hypothetical protein Q4G22_01690 [Paracoccus sp. (in: a-proteobacteria)]|uniref:hypothetical protein n=1 Tax=Paracoccus sp. TaxID=267 RepID=UPI0026DF3A1B|nr:hypothetical protein [Paracoccus sp. (in: a-proteobacteria)]MDO5630528.1 hypothetical protein [Paracoccus sp. (in: a-proteobacteria)]